MKKKRKCVIVFSGFNQRSVIAFIRTLETNKTPYAIIAKSLNDPIFFTEYKKKVMAIRKCLRLHQEDILKSIKIVQEKYKYDEYLIAPTTEALNRLFLENQSYFESHRCTIPLVNKSLYYQISDKYSFGKICSGNHILTPDEFDINKELKFPLVAKPKKYFSSSMMKALSPIILNNKDEYRKFRMTYDIKDFYLQKFISGKSLYLLYYFHRNGTVFKFSQENLVQQPHGKSIVAAMSSNFHNTEESKKYERLFRAINYYGFVMIEVRQHRNNNYMIEANPRFWGPSQLFVDAGMNFFEAFLHDYNLIPFMPRFKLIAKEVKYFWFGGFTQTLKKNQQLTYYNTNECDFMESLPRWLRSDIYIRPDTNKIFIEELL